MFVKNVLTALFCGALLLQGCASSQTTITPENAVLISESSKVVAWPSSAPIPIVSESKESSSRHTDAEIVRGTGQFVKPGRILAEAMTTENGDITFHFVNASIQDVSKAVLGDLLKLDYVVAPGVQGTVTLDTAQPISRDAVLPALLDAFRFAGVAVVQVGGTWRVVSLADAPRQGEPLLDSTVTEAGSPGFSIEIVPLRYVGAEEMQRLLEPLAPQGGILRADQTRNLLVLAGSQAELSSMRDQIATFDVDWLKGMSFAFLPLKVADVKSVAEELGDLLNQQGGSVSSVVRIVPVERMNAILLISPQSAYLDELRTWVERLDRGNEKDDVQLYVYPVQNGRAADLAKVLHKIFGGGVDETGSQPSSRDAGATSANLDSSMGQSFGNSSFSGQSPGMGVNTPQYSSQASNTAQYSSQTSNDAANSGLKPEPNISNGNASAGANGLQITADETNNALLILATAQQYSMIEAALKRLDHQPLQVMIEASIAEVTLTNDLQYGVQYFLSSGNFSFAQTATQSLPPAAPVPGFATVYSVGSNRIILNLLEGVTKVNVVSAPQLMVLNNQTASLQVGDQVPIQTSTAESTITNNAPIVSSIEYRDTGVIVKITPRVNDNGLVLIDIAQEVSDVAPTTTSTLNSPTFSERRFTSSVAVKDGETIALGGLISDSRNKTSSGLPYLRDIPVIGAVFGNESDQNARTELLVLLTPHVIRTDTDAQAATEELRRRLRAVAPVAARVH